ncbi:hypothetical protein HDU78_005242 [Chytriomyces hyalinus]|nr:hypothetical protein HDU78_005242 [Chytriomyces hyalinus]
MVKTDWSGIQGDGHINSNPRPLPKWSKYGNESKYGAVWTDLVVGATSPCLWDHGRYKFTSSRVLPAIVELVHCARAQNEWFLSTPDTNEDYGKRKWMWMDSIGGYRYVENDFDGYNDELGISYCSRSENLFVLVPGKHIFNRLVREGVISYKCLWSGSFYSEFNVESSPCGIRGISSDGKTKFEDALVDSCRDCKLDGYSHDNHYIAIVSPHRVKTASPRYANTVHYNQDFERHITTSGAVYRDEDDYYENQDFEDYVEWSD